MELYNVCSVCFRLADECDCERMEMTKDEQKREPTVAEMEAMMREQAATMPESNGGMYGTRRKDLRSRPSALRVLKRSVTRKHLP